MSDARGDELLAAIRDAPDDRALRLVYADWLMERGDPRGEWIALSCGQETETTDREMRRRALWQHHGRRWMEDDLEGSGLVQIWYRDGFPESATLGGLTHLGPRRLKLHPIRHLTLQVFPGVLDNLASFRVLDTVRFLRLRVTDVSDDELVAFLDGPTPSRLDGIEISGVSRSVWPVLARSRRIHELTQLRVDARADLAELGRRCPALSALELTVPYDSDAWFRGLIETATFRLRTLTLAGVWTSTAAVAQLLASPLARELTDLTIEDLHTSADMAATLARLPCAATLRRLRIGCVGTGAFSISDGLPELAELGIFEAEPAEVMARFPMLAALELTRVDLARRGAERIMASVPHLERLVLDRTLLGDDGVDAIACSAGAPALRQLSLEGAGLGSSAVASIVGSGRLNELRELSLNENRLDLASVRSLADGPFDRMARLRVHETIHEPIEPLFADAWLPIPEAHTYERKLELSGRAVAHARTRR